MLIKVDVPPGYALIHAERMLPRFWATAWSQGLGVRALAPNTLKLKLRHLDTFYSFTDTQFGFDSFDSAISSRDAVRVRDMVELFYANVSANAAYTTTDVQCWDAVRGFVQQLARLRAPLSDDWSALSLMLSGLGGLRSPNRGKVRQIRALPERTLGELLAVAHPESARNPFKHGSVRFRNWFIVNLLLLCGLRRGEALLLEEDSLKQDFDFESGEPVYWLDVTTTFDADPRASAPSIKTAQSHRQIPVSTSLAEVYLNYVAEVRKCDGTHPYLLVSRDGRPLSAESLTKIFEQLTFALSDEAQQAFSNRCQKTLISPHDLRHTCATARYSMFMDQEPNRELAIQRMRAFFGWSATSTMPEHYARAAIQADLLNSWNSLFDERLALLRKLENE